MKDPQHFKKYFHRAWKSKKPPSKVFRVCTRNEENFEKFPIKFCDFLIKIPMENWLFSHFLLSLSRISDASPKVYPRKDKTRFLQRFFRFRVGGVPAFTPSRCYWEWVNILDNEENSCKMTLFFQGKIYKINWRWFRNRFNCPVQNLSKQLQLQWFPI